MYWHELYTNSGDGMTACADLAAEAAKLHPLFVTWRTLLEDGLIGDADFVGAYLLSYVAVRARRKGAGQSSWCAGLRANAMKPQKIESNSENDGLFESIEANAKQFEQLCKMHGNRKYQIHELNYAYSYRDNRRAHSSPLSSFPGLVELLSSGYVLKWMRRALANANSENHEINSFHIASITIYDILHHLRMKNILHYVQDCMENWYCGRRAMKLMFRVPSTMEVLYLQANGFRPVSKVQKEPPSVSQKNLGLLNDSNHVRYNDLYMSDNLPH